MHPGFFHHAGTFLVRSRARIPGLIRTIRLPGIPRLAALACVLAGFAFPSDCRATAVGTTSVEQPVNFGGRAAPSRIPLGQVPVICNYSYGKLSVISMPRPCPLEPLSWKSGSEFNQNLASVFGISVEEGDLGITPKEPVILRLKPWKTPAYSPYSKEQVIAATLWCVLRGAAGSPESPLEIRVLAEAPEDKPLESKFPAKWVNMPGTDGKPVPPVKVSGTRIETDARGIAWVVFTDVKEGKLPSDFPQPTMVPFKNWATESEENTSVDFFPVWGNGGKDENPLGLVFTSANVCYRVFNSHGREEANQLVIEGFPGHCDTSSGDTGYDVSVAHPEVSQEALAAALRALVLTAQPTAERPLRFRMVMEEGRRPRFPAFFNLPGWKELKSKYFTLECTFVWDPEKQTLAKGSFPPQNPESSGKSEPGNADSVWREAQRRSDLAEEITRRIGRGVADGSLQPPADLFSEEAGQSAFAKALAVAGYYAGLASCYNPADPWQIPVDNPIWFNDHVLSQAHRKGWDAGRARGQLIVREAVKEVPEGKPER